MSGPETAVEATLVRHLSNYGFKVLKLTTPGTRGVPDRMILMPKWSPGPPVFVECKAPRKGLRSLQAAVYVDWQTRGTDMRPFVSTIHESKFLADALIAEALKRCGWTRNQLDIHMRESLDAVR